MGGSVWTQPLVEDGAVGVMLLFAGRAGPVAAVEVPVGSGKADRYGTGSCPSECSRRGNCQCHRNSPFAWVARLRTKYWPESGNTKLLPKCHASVAMYGLVPGLQSGAAHLYACDARVRSRHHSHRPGRNQFGFCHQCVQCLPGRSWVAL